MKKWMLFGTALCMLCGVCAFGTTSHAKVKNTDTIVKGVYADSVDLSGMTQAEAEKAIEAYVKTKGSEEITLKVAESEVKVTLEDLGTAWGNKEIAEEAVEIGKSGNLIKRYKELKDLEKESKVFEVTYTADTKKAEQVVAEQCAPFNKNAVDMGLKRENGSFVIIEGEEGVVVSEKESAKNIVEFMENEYSDTDRTVELTTVIEDPKGSREELAKVKDVLGTFTTSFSTSGASRSQNVRNGASLINGTVVYPGEIFSTYETVSPFSTANGYELAGSYLNGKVVDSLGGGICQVSTTLYNAILLSELEVVERSPHSMMVGYVQAAADAAIAGTYKDFKFKNTTDAPVYIEGSTTSGKNITFTVYGEETRPSNRKVTYTNQVLSTTEPTTVLVADGGQGIGYRVVESGHRGCVAELYKNVYIDGDLQSTEKVNKSSYQVSNRTIYYGVVGDEEQSAALQACIAAGDEAGANATIGM